MSAEPLVLGIDGGASGVRLHVVERLATGRLRLGGRSAAQDWSEVSGFEALPLARQLAERDAPDRGRAEREAGQARVHTVANLVAEATGGLPAAPLLIGLCLPGLKTADGRGVAVARRGPRVPDFAQQLERQLRGRQLVLARPLGRLHDDGDAAAWGEAWAANGALVGVRDAYLVACGSGLAEGLVRGGRFQRMAACRDRLPAPWSTGDEDRLGMPGLHAELARRGGGPGLIGDAARRGDAVAREVLGEWAAALGAFLAGRLVRLRAHGAPIERVVVGARGAELLADVDLAPLVRPALETALAAGRAGPVPPGFVVASSLRAAPAIGAAAEALGLVRSA